MPFVQPLILSSNHKQLVASIFTYFQPFCIYFEDVLVSAVLLLLLKSSLLLEGLDFLGDRSAGAAWIEYRFRTSDGLLRHLLQLCGLVQDALEALTRCLIQMLGCGVFANSDCRNK